MAVEHLVRGPASHVLPVVPPAVVIGHEPRVGLGLELADRGEVTPVEGGTPALLEDGLVEPLTDGVVVGRPGRDPLVSELLGHAGTLVASLTTGTTATQASTVSNGLSRAGFTVSGPYGAHTLPTRPRE